MTNTLSTRNKILVVDDEDELVGALLMRLRCAGFIVVSAGDGPTALIMAEKERPDLIVLDVGLPGLDGYAVARLLKANPNTEGIPIIFFTARVTDEDIDTGWEVGATGFLAKIAGPGKIAGSDALLRAVTATLDVWGKSVSADGAAAMIGSQEPA